MAMLLKFIPASAIRAAGRLQYRYPVMKSVINKVGQLMAGKGTIARGPARGLRFDARGCNPGYLAGTSEPREQELVAEHCRAGGTVYDLGANAGFYVMIAARGVGPTGRVVAFEPSPKLCDRIRANVAANGFAHVEVVQAAVSDMDGEVDFGMVGELSVNNSMNAVGSPRVTSSLRVKSVTIDTFVGDGATAATPDLMLIDIEGAELKALQGGLRMLARSLPVLMIEVHWLGPEFPAFIDKELKPLGYTVTTYDGAPLPTGIERYHALCMPPSRGHAPAAPPPP